MFGKFLASYRLSESPSARDWPPTDPADGVRDSADFRSRLAGVTFEEGLYRIHTSASAATANETVAAAFPGFSDRIDCFGFDWLGCEFSLDSARHEGGEPLVLVFEPGTGEVLEVDATFERFHEVELIEFADAAVARGFFNEWAAKNADSLPLPFHDCVGYRVPLFLGGEDAVGNLEVIDRDVYWTLCGQLRRGTLHLPAGARVSSLAIGD
jgi:hypothetical protein